MFKKTYVKYIICLKNHLMSLQTLKTTDIIYELETNYSDIKLKYEQKCIGMLFNNEIISNTVMS